MLRDLLRRLLIGSLLFGVPAWGAAPPLGKSGRVAAKQNHTARVGDGRAIRLLSETESAVRTTPGLSRTTALKRALKLPTPDDATMNQYALQPIVAKMGMGALPILVGSPYRHEGVISEWKIDAAQARQILHAFAKRGTPDVYRNVVSSLLDNPHLADETKRRMVLTTLGGPRRVASGELEVGGHLDVPTPPAELAHELVASTDSTQRVFAAGLLASGRLGTSDLPSAVREQAVDALTHDRELSVRVAAAPLFWQGRDHSPGAQQRFLSLVADPSTVAEVRLDAISAQGWSRERANLWGMPDAAAFRLDAARAEMLGSLLEAAKPEHDISVLLAETSKTYNSNQDHDALYRVAAKRAAESTHLTLPERANAIESMVSRTTYPDQRLLVHFLWEHPEQAARLPSAISMLASFRFAPEYGRMKPEDLATWKSTLSTPDGLRSAFRELAARVDLFAEVVAPGDVIARQKIVRRELDAMLAPRSNGYPLGSEPILTGIELGIPSTELLAASHAALTSNGHHQLWGYHGAVALLAGRADITGDVFASEMTRVIQYGALHLNERVELSQEDWQKAVGLSLDGRLGEGTQKSLVAQIAKGSEMAVRIAAKVLATHPRGAGAFKELAAARPELLLDLEAATPTHTQDRIDDLSVVLRRTQAHLKKAYAPSEPEFRRGVDVFLGSELDSYWKFTQAGARWNPSDARKSAARLLVAPPAERDQNAARNFAVARDLEKLTDAQVDGYFTSFDKSLHEIVEPYRFLADVSRGKGYDFLKARYGTSPLGFARADEQRGQGEAAALTALLSRAPSNSPLWEGALLHAAARSALPDAVRQKLVQEGFTSGYYTNSSADQTLDALSALKAWRGPSIDFAANSLRRAASLVSPMIAPDPKIFALEEVLSDPKLSRDVVRDTMLTLLDRSEDPESGWFHGEAAGRQSVALIGRVLAARKDLSVRDRKMMMAGAGMIVAGTGYKPDVMRARSVQIGRLLDKDLASASMSPLPKFAPGVDVQRISVGSDKHPRAVAILYPKEKSKPTGNAVYYVAITAKDKGESVFGPIALPGLDLSNPFRPDGKP